MNQDNVVEKVIERTAKRILPPETKTPAEPPVAPAKAAVEPALSDPAKRAQQIIRSIDERRRERERLEAERLRRKIEIEREFEERAVELRRREQEIEKLDHSIEQLGLQLTAEVAKVVGKEGR